MYLKSIEIHGFKSFANKLLFEFHNGITGIVGPNGSGKSNVADAVRWVLGEQSAKQLRGAAMTDVIFSGTENRKPLSFAYVAITMDNSDSVLPVEFKEVTVARRVYRSGESEYLINGNTCRLKDVNELFYDTGIGKEGYSIIGQGQIERIISGKPEERRELFDEAAGIVKFKRRKATTIKKLESERENLVRINDILSELEGRVGPLERQSEKAKEYLKKKEELKLADVNSFLLEMDQIEQELSELEGKYKIADDQLTEIRQERENNEASYNDLQENLKILDEKITDMRSEISEADVERVRLEGEIRLLNEQIKTSENSDEHFNARMQTLESEKQEKEESLNKLEQEKENLDAELKKITKRRETIDGSLEAVRNRIKECKEGIEKGTEEIKNIIALQGEIRARVKEIDATIGQINIQKASLNQRRLQRKSEEGDLDGALLLCEEKLKKILDENQALSEKISGEEKSLEEWSVKEKAARTELEKAKEEFHRASAKLESLVNIAERYEGYGGSVKRIMEKRGDNKKVRGVVADLITVDKKYETAIETALGGNIQNIVTEDEATAKEMIAFLKENRFGRATFLPMTSVKGQDYSKYEKALGKKGVIGMANTLVKAEDEYNGILSYLLGRVVCVDLIDNAIALAKEFNYSLHIVTLEGEYLSPGGSMAGGAFKNNSNLLGRNREISEIEARIKELQQTISDSKNRLEEIDTAKELIKSDVEEDKKTLQDGFLKANTAKLEYNQAKEKKEESIRVFKGLAEEAKELDERIEALMGEKSKIDEDLKASEKRQSEIEGESKEFKRVNEEQEYMEETAVKEYAAVQIEESSFTQKVSFNEENIVRVKEEIEKLVEEQNGLKDSLLHAKEDIEKKKEKIEETKALVEAKRNTVEETTTKLNETIKKKEALGEEGKNLYKKSEELSNNKTELEKEIFRLNARREKLEGDKDVRTNYMWSEYELTYHNALPLKNPEVTNLSEIKKVAYELKDAIRRLGDVNVNAIEEFKEVNERYTFLKTQHDDLIEAEKTLMGIIKELDEGMRKQFTEQFEIIKSEFDKAFKELFGGGKGTVELDLDEEGTKDILECGIRIIAQPPGKKLQNMMQLSGGEKSLTAIALLFAIQNMKPSPFCLLDEIEAALDDSNVDRFAHYLHKLTKNTQFIIITHRRGTMNSADRLYGITMQEKGVSTLVSVNLIEAEIDD